jgi:hypothetical protein
MEENWDISSRRRRWIVAVCAIYRCWLASACWTRGGGDICWKFCITAGVTGCPGGVSCHCSKMIVLLSRLIAMTITTRTSPREFSNHHFTSSCSLGRDSVTLDSITRVGQPGGSCSPCLGGGRNTSSPYLPFWPVVDLYVVVAAQPISSSRNSHPHHPNRHRVVYLTCCLTCCRAVGV